jgi:lactate 2-monooxygenase
MRMTGFGGYQNEIYGAGLQGVLPTIPVDAANLEARATAAMSESLRNYVQGGCGDEHTQNLIPPPSASGGSYRG